MKCTWEPLLEAADFNSADYGDWVADGEMLAIVADELQKVVDAEATDILQGVESGKAMFFENLQTGNIVFGVSVDGEIYYWKRVCSGGVSAGFPMYGVIGAGVGALGGYLLGNTRAAGRNGAFGATLGALIGGGAGILFEKNSGNGVGMIPRQVRLRSRGAIGATPRLAPRGPVGAVTPRLAPRGSVGSTPQRIRYQPRGPIGVGYVPPKVEYTPRGPVGYGHGLRCTSC